jgi:hypothetical protein
MQSLPVLEGRPHQILLSTGAVTVPNYSDTKAGKKAEGKHKYGFVIVETSEESEDFYIRQVEALKNGSFIDLKYSVKGGTVTEIDNCKALIMGDTHCRWLDKEVHEVRKVKLCGEIEPQYIIQHDIIDGDSVNHHEAKNPIKAFHRHETGRNLISAEIQEVFEYVRDWGDDKKLVVVSANHNDWLDKYIINMDWKHDIPNALQYMDYAQILLKGEAPDGILAYLLNSEFDNVKTLGRDDSFMLLGVELSYHGDVGANGSRGNIKQFAKLSTPSVIGHSHTPSRIDDTLQVGAATNSRMEYVKGASSHLNADVVLHNNGKCQHIIYINRNFTNFF